MVLNSLNAHLAELSDADMLALLKERGIYLSAAGDRLKVNAPPGTLDEPLRAELLRRKQTILAILNHGLQGWDEKPLASTNTTGAIPLTAAQERLWVADRFSPGTAAYSMPQAFLIEAPVSPEILQGAADSLLRRHEVLRTYFSEQAGTPAQLLSKERTFPIAFTDLSSVAESEREGAARELIRAEARKPFDLRQPPLIRFHLIRLNERRHVIFLNVHHIIADLRSLAIIRNELTALYWSAMNGRQAELPSLPIQYRDYAIWEKGRLTGALVAEQLGYWKRKLEGAPQSPRLPFSRPRPATPSFQGATRSIAIPKDAADALAALARESGASLFMTLMAAFAVLLHRYSLETDFCLGMPITGRTRVETERLIGLFVNILILRCRPERELSFREFLAQVRETALEAYAHSDVPFQRVVNELNPGRADGNSPLVQIVFSLDPVTPEAEAQSASIDTQQGTAKFDLALQLTEGCDGICGILEYNTDLFEEASIEMFSKSFLSLLDHIVQDPACPLGRLNLGMAPGSSGPRHSYPRELTISRLFEEQALRTPDATALVSADISITYGELNRRTNQLARFLREQGVSKESTIGIAMERSPEAIVAMLAILKAGGAYVPLDPAYPSERLKYFLEDANVTVLLTQDAVQAKVPHEKARVLCIDKDWPKIARESEEPLEASGTSDDLAYVMYTSGSTGKPKGVLIPHRGVIRLVKDAGYANLDESEVFLQFAPLAFDASTFEIWAALLNGGRLAVMPPQASSLDGLERAIQRYGVTTLWLTAGLFHAIVDERIQILKPLRQLLAGGDVLSPKHVRRFREEAPECRLINGYGPTENTTFTCCYTVPAGGPRRGSIPIGTPISNTTIYLLDANLGPVAPGAPGELYIGGDGLALGYLNNPALTDSKFVANPFSEEPGARLFRSGDSARYLPDGNLEFLGRTDSQVKINGFRIETGEIESVLSSCPDIADAVVIARQDIPGQKYLAAYVVLVRDAATGNGQLLGLRSLLLQSLPSFMQPATITVLERLPLTENGKVDRAALPVPRQSLPERNRARSTPADEVESRLLAIWEEVLGIRPIGLTDDFFTLGGHSVLALRVFAKIEAEWGLHLPLSMLLKAPTVERLAKALRQDNIADSWSSLVTIQSGNPGDARPPLYIVSGVGGNVVRFRELARHLGPDQPVFALQPPGLDGEQPYLTRLEDLAAHHVREIRAKQKNGPYHLAGYSFGGAVVFEMARQLDAQGEEAALVALLDAPEWHYSARVLAEMGWRRWLVRSKSRVKRLLFGPDRFGYLWDRLKRLGPRCVYTIYDFVGLPFPQRVGDIIDVNMRAVSAYRPKSYRGKIVLLRTAGDPALDGDDTTLGWGALAKGGVEVHEIPGNHEDLATEPNVQFLAQILTSCLRAAAK